MLRMSLAVAALLAAVSLAACGSSGSSSSTGNSGSTGTETTSSKNSGSGNAGTSGGLAAAEEAVKRYEAQSSPIEVTTPLKSPPATGKSIDYVQCGAPVCAEIGEVLKGITGELGWKLKVLNGGLAPQELLAALNAAIADSPDGVIGGNLTREQSGRELEELESKGIPYVALATNGSAEGGVTGIVLGSEDFAKSSELMADWVAADSAGSAKTAFFNDPNALPLGALIEEQFKTSYEEACPGCELELEKVSATGIGTEIPKLVVSYVQRHPEIEYLGFGLSEFLVGVPQALAQVGLGADVKLISRGGGSPPTLESISEGGPEKAVIAESSAGAAYQLVDLLARAFNGESTSCCTNKVVPHQILTESNIENPKVPFDPRFDFKKYYDKLWGLEG